MPEDRVPPERRGSAGAGALPRPHGSADPQHAGALNGDFFSRPDFMTQRPSHRPLPPDSMSGSSWTATAAGPPGRDFRARPGIAPAPTRSGAVVEAAPRAGIGTLTLFAFSSDNWRRPAPEVAWLMRLFREYLVVETARCVANGVRLEIIGRRDRLGPGLLRARGGGRGCHRGAAPAPSPDRASTIRARDAIIRAAQCLRPERPPRASRSAALVAIVDHGVPGAARSTC